MIAKFKSKKFIKFIFESYNPKIKHNDLFIKQILSAEINNVILETFKSGELVINNGYWKGDLKYGIWFNREWIDGIWEGERWFAGDWKKGIWKSGEWLTGNIYDYNENKYKFSELSPKDCHWSWQNTQGKE